MSVSKTFKNSIAGQVLALAVEQSDGKLDFDAMVALALKKEILKPSKAQDPKLKSTSKSTDKRKKTSKWGAFLRWCKVYSVWEGIKIKRSQMKAIWTAYEQADYDRWQEIADLLAADGSVNIRDVPNKPEIVVPPLDSDDESGSESESGGED